MFAPRHHHAARALRARLMSGAVAQTLRRTHPLAHEVPSVAGARLATPVFGHGAILADGLTP